MISPNSVRLDVKDFGKQFILTGIRPAFKYEDGSRTDERVGTTYEVSLPALGYEKIRVRVSGEQSVSDEILEDRDFHNVKFDNLIAYFYFVNNQVGISASADKVTLV